MLMHMLKLYVMGAFCVMVPLVAMLNIIMLYHVVNLVNMHLEDISKI